MGKIIVKRQSQSKVDKKNSIEKRRKRGGIFFDFG